MATVSELVKKSVCGKVSAEHMGKDFYSPCCVLQCKDICGSRHSKRADKCSPLMHKVTTFYESTMLFKGLCGQGQLPLNFLFCPSTSDQDTTLTYTSFEVNI